MRQFVEKIPRRAFLGTMLAGSAVITAYSLPYFDFETLPPFVVEKLPVRFEALWLASLRLHVASAALAFPLCLALMTRWVQRRATWHRRLGRVAGTIVLLGLVPSGAVLAFDAKGGAIVTAGFLLSAAIVASSIVHGVRAARRRDLVAHGRAMRHVLAQMSVAVASRAMIIGFDAAGLDPRVAYVVALWVPVLGCAAIAEVVSVPASSRFRFVERIRREVTSPALVMRPRVVARPLVRSSR